MQVRPGTCGNTFVAYQTLGVGHATLNINLGSEHPRYKAAAESLAARRRALAQALATARAKAKVLGLDEFKTEWHAAQERADALGKTVERLKTELGLMSKALQAQAADQTQTQPQPPAKPAGAAPAHAGQKDSPADRAQALNTVLIKTQSRLRDLDQEIRELQMKLAIDGGLAGLNVKQRELTELIDRKIDLEMNVSRARETYEEVARRLQDNKDVPEVTKVVRNDDYAKELRRRLDDTEIRRDVLASKGAAEGNPVLADLKAEIAAVQRKLDAARADAAAQAKAELLAGAKDRFESSERQIETILKRVDNLKSDLGELANAQRKLDDMLEQHKRLREQLREVKSQIDEIMFRRGVEKN